ncbi:hypothetical protein BT96DRAFT_977949 [Gymnopus androsaceus JB14]|uniref:Uncharacterized protein n=1 Tax=Gymnopus androsaceus JB14 TaxID=1447944 RepID=A0A6A4HE19_9AGAR|nr:hypothetical protein BT96DRAFT_977949 [Gymnopus androsaceus JB14]
MSATEFAAAPPSYNAKATEAGEDAPPPYELESMVVQAYEEFEKKYKEDPVAAEKALAEALGNSDSSKAFVKDMDGLSLTIGTLNTLFGNVESGLATVDAEKLHDATGKITEWQPQWKVIRSFYTDTMLKSRTLATSLANRVEMFFKHVLPKLKDDNLTAQQKDDMLTYFLGEKANATNYNEELKKDEDAAEQMYKDFLKVQTDVATFKSQFGVWFQQAQDQLQKEITDLKGEIDKIKADLESLVTKRNISLGVAAGGVVAAGAGGIMMATGVLAPLGAVVAVIGALAALGGGIAAAVLQSKIADKQAELNSKQADYNALLAKQERVNKVLKPLVESLNKDMVDIGEKLETMKSVWSFIKSQAQTARLEVKKPIDSEAPSFLKAELIDSSVQAYKVLHTCVKMYGEGYDKARK